MTAIQDTSLKVYFEKVLPTLAKRRAQVFHACLKQYPLNYTNMELARELGWSINRVTPRVLELRQRGLLIHSETRVCNVTHNMAMAWTVPRNEESAVLHHLLHEVQGWLFYENNLEFREDRIIIREWIPTDLWNRINVHLQKKGFRYLGSKCWILDKEKLEK